MAYENVVLTLPYPTSADLSGDVHRIVALTGTEEVARANAVAGIGILQNKPDGSASGQQITTASVMVYGVSRCVAGAAVAQGAQVTADAQGRAVTAGAGAASTGIALAAAGAAGEIIPVLLTPGGQAP